MFIKNWKKEICTIPNLLSLFRLFLIPVYVLIYLNATKPADYFLAAAVLTVSCLTDLIDGKIARRFHMASRVGQVLDPVADKLTQLALIICLSIEYPVLHFVLGLFVIKEAYQGIVMIVFLYKGKMLPGAVFAGKLCTTVLFISLILLVLLPDLDPRLVDWIAIIDFAFLTYSFVAYYFAYFGKNKKIFEIDES